MPIYTQPLLVVQTNGGYNSGAFGGINSGTHNGANGNEQAHHLHVDVVSSPAGV